MKQIGMIAFTLFQLSAWGTPYFVGRAFPSNQSRYICGEDDMVAMKDQEELVQRMGWPVGRLTIDHGSYTSYCSGILVDKDLFLTAAHCGGRCSRMNVQFGFLYEERRLKFDCDEIVEQGDDEYPEDDYMVIRLQGKPGIEWGWVPLSDKRLEKNDQLMIIHHPSAQPMKVSLKNCLYKYQYKGMLNHVCDTENGSSGAGILSPDFDHVENTRVVGVHAIGGDCDEDDDPTNRGPAIRNLAKSSELIRSLIQD